MTMKIAILISGRGSNMLALADELDRGQSHDAPLSERGKIVLVAADSSCAGLALAKERGLATAHISYSGRPKQESEAEMAATLNKAGVDVIFLAGFMRVLSAEFVTQFEGRILNIHPSLLPKYKGLDTHQRALDANDSTHGVSVHFVTAGLDEGPLIAQAFIPILGDDTQQTLAARLLPLEHALYGAVMTALLSGELVLHEGHATWHQKPLIAPQYGTLSYPR